MQRSGFEAIRVQAASFSHNRLPIWLARLNNAVTYPLRKLPLLKYFAWLCLFYGRKAAEDQSGARSPEMIKAA